ncbi:MAG: hypothetical protein AAGB34_04370 [Planctomycetota bacterium]
MAKLFYNLPEAAQRLQKSEDDVLAMAQRGEISELRNGDELVFKKDQIDLLAPDDDSESDIGASLSLADTAQPGAGGGGSTLGLSLEDTQGGASATGLGLSDTSAKGDSGGATGMSVFDADELEDDDPAAQTQIEDLQGGLDADTLESFGSGSGLMELTQESDDTSLGADGLLDDLGGPADDPAFADTTAGGGALFEGDDEEEAAAVPAGGMVAAEPYDGGGSGLTGGASLAASIVLLLGISVVIMAMVGFIPMDIVAAGGAMTPVFVAGGGVALIVVLGVLGLVLGSKG